MFSSNAAIDSFPMNEDNIAIRGYVDGVIGPKIVGKNQLNLFKFTVNNGAGKRVQCLAWEKNVEKAAAVVKMDKIVFIEGCRAQAMKSAQYNIGNVPIEITILPGTEITIEGDREMQRQSNAAIVANATWADVADREGETIRIAGWVKSRFRATTHSNNESSVGMGSITDGNNKLEIRVTSMTNFPEGLVPGVSVEVTGTVCYTTFLYVRVDSGEKITPTEEDSFPNPEIMINIVTPPAKRQRTA